MRLPTLRQLQYFVAVAEATSFRRAADRLRVSQPTLTVQVSALEELLGLTLFERSRSGSRLTPAGEELLTGARRVLEELQGVVDRAESIGRGPGGTYRLGVTPTLGPYLLPYVLPSIHRKYESLKFFVREGAPSALERDLAAGEHDLILTPLPIERGDLSVAPILREPVHLVASAEHPLAKRERVLPEDLRDQPVLTLQEHHHFHRQIRQLCDRLQARILRDYEGTSLDTLRQMVVLDMGVAFLPALYVLSEVHRPAEVHVTSIDGETIERTHALAWRRSSPAAHLFEGLAEDMRAEVSRSLKGKVRAMGEEIGLEA